MKLTNSSFRSIFLISVLATFATQLSAQSITPEEAIVRLQEGNVRFASGKSLRPNQTVERIKQLSTGQNPFAIIMSCSDSRVPSEIVFDQGLGDLFIVRTAGQVSSYASWGSMEFAVAVLGAKLIVVMGHTKCGAVAAACKVPEVPGHIVTLINAIKPAAEKALNLPGEHIENSVKVNVAMQVQMLRSLEPVFAKRVRSGELQIIGGVYDLDTGKVEFLSEKFIKEMNK
jgi:carbonic anhydrase